MNAVGWIQLVRYMISDGLRHIFCLINKSTGNSPVQCCALYSAPMYNSWSVKQLMVVRGRRLAATLWNLKALPKHEHSVGYSEKESDSVPAYLSTSRFTAGPWLARR